MSGMVERNEDSAIYMEMDRRDQLQIVAEAMGEVVTEMVYEVHGKKGLSYKGTNTIAFYMGDVGIRPGVEWERIEMNHRVYWSATVQGYNEKYNLTALGTAEAPEMMEVYDREEHNEKIPDGKGGFKTHLEFDEHCRRKALSKAQRNAKRAVMPEPVLLKWLTYFWDKKQGRDVQPPFKPRVAEAEYTVLGDTDGEEGSENKGKQGGTKKKPRVGPPPKTQETSKGKESKQKTEDNEPITAKIVEASLNLAGFDKKKLAEKLDIKEDEEYVIVAIKDEINDEVYYHLEQALGGFNPEYRETGLHGEFYIKR